MQHAFYVHFFAVFDDYDVKMPNFALQGGFKPATVKFYFPRLNLDIVPWNSTLGVFACI